MFYEKMEMQTLLQVLNSYIWTFLTPIRKSVS